MMRTVVVYGLVSGHVSILGILATIVFAGGHHAQVWVGYLIMLVALSSILVGVKQYRDRALGGVIRFRTAFLLGLGIALVAALAYVAVWEVYQALSDNSYIDQYIAQTLQEKRAAGVSGAAYDKLAAEMETMRVNYANPLFRLPVTFSEIFPVGLLIALVSAALLRNPRFLPARSRPGAG